MIRKIHSDVEKKESTDWMQRMQATQTDLLSTHQELQANNTFPLQYEDKNI